MDLTSLFSIGVKETKIRIEKDGQVFEVFDIKDKQEVIITPKNASITMEEEEHITDMVDYLLDMARKPQ